MVDYDLLVPYGWTESTAEEYLPLIDPGFAPARIVRMDRGECDVVTPDGPDRATCPRSDSEISGLCTGDWALLDTRSHIRALLPRRSVAVSPNSSVVCTGNAAPADTETA